MIEWVISSSVLILLVVGIRILFRNKIKQWIRYALWLIVLMRLLIPFSIVKSDVSIMNVVSQIASVVIISNVVFMKKLSKARRVLEIESKLPVYIADIIQTPCMFGVFRPAIYITNEVANDKNTLRYVLAHEEMH